MHNLETQQAKDFAPTAYNFAESENPLYTQAKALLDNRSMQSQIDSANLVEKGILNNFSIGNEGKPVQLAEAYTKENAPVPIKILPPGPRPKEQVRQPMDGAPIGPGSKQAVPRRYE